VPVRDKVAAMVDDEDNAKERPSRSARKRESEALQELGEQLVDLHDSILAQIDLPETLRDAILAARAMTSHGALLRQRQYIGRLMRTIDAGPIRAVLDREQLRHRASGARFHRVEEWRQRLLLEGVPAIAALAAIAPNVESAELSRLIDAAKRAHDDPTRRAAARALFRYLDRHFPA
jgi:ribosome-associated protein